MALILDTAAVIGWVELQDPGLLQHLSDHAGDDIPMIHAVTLGELEGGVVQAPDDMLRSVRRSTLTFAREELDVVPLEKGSDLPELFGLVAASVSRKISHNDCWITAAAVSVDRELVTQDGRLVRQLETAVAAENPLTTWLTARDRRLTVTLCERG